MKSAALLALCLAWATADAQTPPTDPAGPIAALARFAGTWAGTASGQAGEGQVERRYEWVMRGRYLSETNLSRYPAQSTNPKGEEHEHRAMFSYDKPRQALVLRQFHVEGFVNTYRQASPPGQWPLVFESESFENFSNSWKARETYEFAGDDEFVETFELAPPGKPYEVYSRTRLKRTSR